MRGITSRNNGLSCTWPQYLFVRHCAMQTRNASRVAHCWRCIATTPVRVCTVHNTRRTDPHNTPLGFDYMPSTMHLSFQSRLSMDGAKWPTQCGEIQENAGGSRLLLFVPRCSGQIRCGRESNTNATCAAATTIMLCVTTLVWCEIYQENTLLAEELAAIIARDCQPRCKVPG